MKPMMTFLFLLGAFPALSAVHHVELTSTKKGVSGHIQFITSGSELKVVAQVKGLKPGSVHGFHIHENGKCDKPSFESAGGHFNPNQGIHAAPSSKERHLGDLGNLVANKKGLAFKELVFNDVSEKEAKEIVGKAVIVHAKADDFSSQPSGDSGNRIACGIIKGDGAQ